MTPLPVEITNHTDWWVQWLPPAITLLVAFIALGGVIWTSIAADKRSKHDREDAQQREYLRWQRDTILRLGTEAAEASEAAIRQYAKIGNSDQIKRGDFEPVHQAYAQIHSVALSLGLIGAMDAGRACLRLRTAMNAQDITDVPVALNAAYRQDRDTTEAEATLAEIGNELQKLRPAKSEER